ncbi:HepT-like ribonuclease domain-containing protein [uncultured Thiodictyon sp.]|uniref:HepT-like ribonuclease domain-containing protein n=1 Tax=uncultured Thiodictyon sp. TaxID=1846217 RepID=UPI0025E4AF3C|nr:HepT-like ribonuclease domain-containing protein [uncultured Thiodictyon sp.]
MIGFPEKVTAYTDGLDQRGFLSDGLTYDATLSNLELIGEAATRVPGSVRNANPQVPWRLPKYT